mmetsp:Transcript_1225/g.3563  ORF Transcript_1225/g.3563 Transcript_1225/m.3563 type:complete len:226 (-) Transcript_1225:94-771(-)
MRSAVPFPGQAVPARRDRRWRSTSQEDTLLLDPSTAAGCSDFLVLAGATAREDFLRSSLPPGDEDCAMPSCDVVSGGLVGEVATGSWRIFWPTHSPTGMLTDKLSSSRPPGSPLTRSRRRCAKPVLGVHLAVVSSAWWLLGFEAGLTGEALSDRRWVFRPEALPKGMLTEKLSASCKCPLVLGSRRRLAPLVVGAPMPVPASACGLEDDATAALVRVMVSEAYRQ